MMENSSKNS